MTNICLYCKDKRICEEFAGEEPIADYCEGFKPIDETQDKIQEVVESVITAKDFSIDDFKEVAKELYPEIYDVIITDVRNTIFEEGKEIRSVVEIKR